MAFLFLLIHEISDLYMLQFIIYLISHNDAEEQTNEEGFHCVA